MNELHFRKRGPCSLCTLFRKGEHAIYETKATGGICYRTALIVRAIFEPVVKIQRGC